MKRLWWAILIALFVAVVGEFFYWDLRLQRAEAGYKAAILELEQRHGGDEETQPSREANSQAKEGSRATTR
jgi:hypothetical protein